jgi:predicted GNAT superfamily acetyltransferase
LFDERENGTNRPPDLYVPWLAPKVCTVTTVSTVSAGKSQPQFEVFNEEPVKSSITYSVVSTLRETKVALELCREVWGANAVQDVDLYFVAATHGGYLGLAWLGAEAVGASFGLLSDGGRGLHSHMTAVVPKHAGAGIGYGLKQHQRAWAADQGIECITWTYDPLVRRNAWFNLVRLGAQVSGYEVNYYGALGDAINGNDESDRLMITWPVNAAAGSVIEPFPRDVLVSIPDDIESIRSLENTNRADPNESSQWRVRMRAELHPRLAEGWQIVGLSAEYQYVLRRPT